MKAEKSNVVNTQRVNLGEAVPLDMPFSLFVDVCNACNFKCRFCAIQTTEITEFKKQLMSWELYKKIIDDAAEFPRPLKMLRLAGNGEPLLNKDLARMIRYAKEKNGGVSEHIEIVSNASLLTPEMIDAMVDAGLNRIRISIEAVDAEGYEEMSGAKINWEEFIDNIRYFYEHRKQCEIYIKTVDAAIKTEQDQERFYQTFENICDKISIEHVVPVWAGYEKIYDDFSISKKEGLHGHALKDVDICPMPFYSFIIHPDGEATVCCADWRRGIKVGNVLKESVMDIWKSEKYNHFLAQMIKNGRRNCNSTCAVCDYPNYDAVDDMDPYRDRLLKKYCLEKR